MNAVKTHTFAGYSGGAKVLHWLIVALLIAQFVVAWTMPEIRRDTPVTTLISLHFTFGIIILGVAVIRLFVRVQGGTPAPEAGIPGWQETSSQIVHWLLYALLLAVPVLGWINADWRGMPIVLFGYELPHLIAARAAGWQWTGDVHGVLANFAMLILVGVHAVAALYHHFVMHDGVLKRMLPGR
ncbi:cytochrome b [Undibacter mobilis]|nr:cytochrome b [Undibacter mobilis]